MERFTLSDRTLLDSSSPEYFWISWMLSEGYSVYKIKNSVMKAFGGDETIAQTMLDVVKGTQSKFNLIQLVQQNNVEVE
ncbi:MULTISPECIES: hypothetical protein [unclassified Vibrio]|uniref:hypothetical protein n=1 Tax=unclassified Vibrio TaxID=2614977 RepID=UPI001268B9AD|nr:MULTISPECIES: hypothetical protein [unclassified Vibrio]QFT35247.1 hypothetical protein FIU99_02250 [Vibrio sp. THAF64]QGM33146.1 hypothetical protein GGC04_02255 [Vibrio sp. THAF191d]QGN68648.1 hypothetical protein GGC03_02250 [Vibrio sp. THAF191c]